VDGLLNDLAFGILAVVTLGSAWLVATLKNLSRAAVFMVIFFLGLAGFYFLLQAEFLAMVEVMVYAGAVAILFAFVIMLSPKLPEEEGINPVYRVLGVILGAAFVVVMGLAFSWLPLSAAPAGNGVPLADLGKELLSTYLLPFELVSVLLLVALVSAVVYTKSGHEGGRRP